MRALKRIANGTSAAVLVLSSLMSLGFTSVAHAASGSDTCTWTGATDLKFSTAGNWSGCSSAAPVNGDSLVFNVTSLSAQTTLNNDITNLSVNSLTFQGSNSNGYGYELDGNAVTLTGGITVNGTVGEAIALPLTISGNQTFSTPNSSELIVGQLSGTGDIALSGGTTGMLFSLNSSPNYSGTITPDAKTTVSLLSSGGTFTLGGSLVIAGGAVVSLVNRAGTDVTYHVPMSVGGDGSALSGGAIDLSGYTNYTDTLSADLTLTSDVLVTGAGGLNITGAVNGGFSLSPKTGESVTITSGGSTQQSAIQTTTIQAGDDQPNTGVMVSANNVVILDGTRGNISVDSKGVLKGTGTASTVDVFTGGTVAPGHSPGKLTVLQTLTLGSGSTYQAELKDKTAGDFDQLVVGNANDTTGNDVSLGDGTPSDGLPTLDTELYSGFNIKAGDQFEIINNLSQTPVLGTFNNLPEGATFKVGNGVFSITYKGGDGNDVVLTAVTAPTAPDTGFALVSSHPAATLGVTVLCAGTLIVLAKMNRRQAIPGRGKGHRR